jgi:ABC-type multidrug transport system ATPase subunit
VGLTSRLIVIAYHVVRIIDEPSCGMDPSSRRSMWHVLSAEKHGRATILTTHSMHEADYLSSRIGIMVNGKLRCLGSSQYLKSSYGSGYEMEIKTKDTPECITRVKSLVHRLINHHHASQPTADATIATADIPPSSSSSPPAMAATAVPAVIHPVKLLEDFGGKLRFALPGSPIGATRAPRGSSNTGNAAAAATAGWTLSHLFSELEANRSEYQIEDYIISQATLEQVFISFAKHQDESHVI